MVHPSGQMIMKDKTKKQPTKKSKTLRQLWARPKKSQPKHTAVDDQLYGTDIEVGRDILDIMDVLPFYVMLVDETHHILLANRAVQTQIGLEAKDIIGQYCPKVIHGRDEPIDACPLEEAVEEGQAIEREILDPESGRWVNSAIYPTERLTRDGKRVFFHMVTDISDRKQAEEQLIQAEKLSSLGQLAASVTHEVNNPLSGVLIYIKLLIKRITSGDFSKEATLNYLSKMEAELIRSTKLLQNLLDFARQSSSTLEEVNVNEVINRACDVTAHSAELQNIKVIKELSPSLSNIMANFDQLQQVCTNLILNAIQAMPEGGRLTLRTSAGCSAQLKIEVRDTDCGISPENMRKLFTPFFTTKREVKGVGLGLAVSYGIVQRYQGRIKVQSKEGKGTTFTIYLPLHREEKG